jgi:uncharacterized protein (DUF697 family)
MLGRLKTLFSKSAREARVREHLNRLRGRLPVPVFWLFGKTQSGKTSLIKYLTGADQAEIGRGFAPCTRFSRKYEFPTPEAPLVTFLDTRGLDEPGYDPAEDLKQFNAEAHVVVVTVKALDHAQENVVTHLRTLRKANPTRSVVLVLTCLHEAYPQQQHPQPYPFADDGAGDAAPPADDGLARSLAEQRRGFEGLVDRVVPVDLTPPEEGFDDPAYGGEHLRAVLLDVLPAAMRQTLLTLGDAARGLGELYARQALPHIVGYSTLASAAGAVPLPLLDLALLSAIQSRMVYHLAELYGQPLNWQRFWELAGTLGGSLLFRQAVRESVKLIPFVGPVTGSVACAALAGASTFALGKAACYYYQAVHQGHVPQADELRRYFREQLALAEGSWKRVAESSRKAKAAGGNGKGRGVP